jgi:(p)ppGpp synthase/HD superfamily hydrolase
MTLIEQARQFAHEAHDSIKQVRKYTGEPYWTHTDEVAAIVQALPVGYIPSHEVMVAAAHLHDVVEDVNRGIYTLNYITGTFGGDVGKLVWELTDRYTKEVAPKYNRATRKDWERQRLGTISPAGKTIKLADLISNTKSIVEHDPEFAKLYIGEKLALLPYLVGGEESLWERAFNQANISAEILGLDKTNPA